MISVVDRNETVRTGYWSAGASVLPGGDGVRLKAYDRASSAEVDLSPEAAERLALGLFTYAGLARRKQADQ